MTSSPSALPVTILQNKEGSVVDELEFVVQSLQGDTSAKPVKAGEQRTVSTEQPQIVEEKVVPPPQVVEKKIVPPPQIVEKKVVPPPQVLIKIVVPPPQPKIKAETPCIVIADANKKGYVLQISSWITKIKAIQAVKKVKKYPGLQAFVMTERIQSLGLQYRIFVGVFKTREEAIAFCHQFNFD
jgi:hypothetical protein